jgi:predicted Holliday junction resolvase-like endonuclease
VREILAKDSKMQTYVHKEQVSSRVVECLDSKHEALNSNTSMAKKKEKKRKTAPLKVIGVFYGKK